MSSIQQNIEQITSQIRTAEKKCGRTPESVQLLAVSKTKPNDAILEAALGGQVAFGENYVQEGAEKVAYFNENHPDFDIEWHFIGPIQSNKSRLVADHFDWVHTIDREKIARRLNDQRSADSAPLNVLIQVNISNEASKSGIDLTDVDELARFITSQPNLKLRGLMSIPASMSDHESQVAVFKALADKFHQLAESNKEIDTLSMGMSGDMEAAIEAGTTMVRVGTAIFGARDYQK